MVWDSQKREPSSIHRRREARSTLLQLALLLGEVFALDEDARPTVDDSLLKVFVGEGFDPILCGCVEQQPMSAPSFKPSCYIVAPTQIVILCTWLQPDPWYAELEETSLDNGQADFGRCDDG